MGTMSERMDVRALLRLDYDPHNRLSIIYDSRARLQVFVPART